MFNFNCLTFAKELYVYGWFGTIPDAIIKKFTKETGIVVYLSSYENNETMYSKLMLLGNQPSYDIVIPSTYFIEKMAKKNFLLDLDISKIPNLKNINQKILNKKFDPNNRYSIPFATHLTGIMYNLKFINKKIDSWYNLFDQSYKNKVLLLDDVREVYHIGLSLLGYDINTKDEKKVKEAYNYLRSLMPNINIFAVESTKKYFLSQDVFIGMNWNSDAYAAINEDKDLRFIYPKEGAILSIDSFVILKNSRNQENAYKFINFILRSDIAKAIIEETGASLPNTAAQDLLDPLIKNNTVIFPSTEIINKSLIHEDLGKSSMVYVKYWNMLKVEN